MEHVCVTCYFENSGNRQSYSKHCNRYDVIGIVGGFQYGCLMVSNCVHGTMTALETMLQMLTLEQKLVCVEVPPGYIVSPL